MKRRMQVECDASSHVNQGGNLTSTSQMNKKENLFFLLATFSLCNDYAVLSLYLVQLIDQRLGKKKKLLLRSCFCVSPNLFMNIKGREINKSNPPTR